MDNLPIACTLQPAALRARGDSLLPGLARRASAVEEIAKGYRLRFEVSTALLQTVAQVVDAERQCCRFLKFSITVAPDGGPLWLELTGPEGTREFLAGLFAVR
jgi:hypothetical protein